MLTAAAGSEGKERPPCKRLWCNGTEITSKFTRGLTRDGLPRPVREEHEGVEGRKGGKKVGRKKSFEERGAMKSWR